MESTHSTCQQLNLNLIIYMRSTYLNLIIEFLKHLSDLSRTFIVFHQMSDAQWQTVGLVIKSLARHIDEFELVMDIWIKYQININQTLININLQF